MSTSCDAIYQASIRISFLINSYIKTVHSSFLTSTCQSYIHFSSSSCIFFSAFAFWLNTANVSCFYVLCTVQMLGSFSSTISKRKMALQCIISLKKILWTWFCWGHASRSKKLNSSLYIDNCRSEEKFTEVTFEIVVVKLGFGPPTVRKITARDAVSSFTNYNTFF